MKFVVPGNPKPKERPRVNRNSGVIYTPRTTKKHEELIGWHALACGEKFGGKDVMVSTWFYFKNKKKADGDNCHKLVTDSLQSAGIINNDVQVIDGDYHIREDKHEPRTEVEIISVDQAPPCVYCGKPANTVFGGKSATCDEHHDLVDFDTG